MGLAAWIKMNEWMNELHRGGVFKVAQFNGLIEIYQRPTLYPKNVEYIADIISYTPANYNLHQQTRFV